MDGPPSVHIVILNWNGWHFTLECLRSLQSLDYPAWTVHVVDNGSTDDSLRRLRDSGLVPAVLENGANLGFGAGCNPAIRRSLAEGADYVWLLNNDTRVHPGSLTAMVRKAESEPEIGAVGSVLYYRDSPDRVQAWGGGGMSLWTGRPWHAVRPTPRLTYLTGASMLLRAEALQKIGLFDERFFFFWEDTDLGFRLRRGGWRLAVAEDSVIWHAESASVGKRTALRARYFMDGLVRFLRKHAVFPPVPAVLALSRQLARAAYYRSWALWKGTWQGWLKGWRESPGVALTERPARRAGDGR